MASALLESFDGLLPSASVFALRGASSVLFYHGKNRTAETAAAAAARPPVLAARSNGGTTSSGGRGPRTKVERASRLPEMEADDAFLWDVGAALFAYGERRKELPPHLLARPLLRPIHRSEPIKPRWIL